MCQSLNMFLLLITLIIAAPRVAVTSYLSERFAVLSSPQVFSKSLLSYLSQKRDLSHRCRDELEDFATSLQSERQWALNMYDANGKLPAGAMEGNLIELGSFDECLRIVRTNNHGLTGKYCLGSLYVSSRYVDNATIRLGYNGMDNNKMEFGVCFPDSCSAPDLELTAKGIGLNMSLTEDTCQTKQTQSGITAGGYVILALACLLLLLIVASTIYELCFKADSHWALKSFSLWTNGKIIFRVSKPGASDISCLCGIRVVAMVMVILKHIFIFRHSRVARNSYYYSYWIHQPKNGPLMSLPFAADLFLQISGCLVAYNYLRRQLKRKEFNIPSYYIERYLRLTPAVLAVMLFIITWFGYIGSGPLWYQTKGAIEPCQTHWWSCLLYIQNYQSAMCIPQSWYLSVDFQLYVLSPLLLVPLARWRRETIAITAGVTLISIATAFVEAWTYKLCAENQCGEQTVFMKQFYTFLPARASSWLIGFLLGCFMFKVKEKEMGAMEKRTAIPLMVFALLVYVATIFGDNHVVISEYDRYENSFSLALLRPTMLLSVGCIVYLCEIGRGGIVASFLTNPVFVVVSRLTYTTYLVHYHVLEYHLDTARVGPHLSNYTLLVNDFAGVLLLSLLIGLVVSLAVEVPAQHFVSFLTRGSRKSV
ncbi:nose resistant to fluoxetine protein 6-like [Photinus pyralis]|uniref:nose resistant to fluoxetine protein 6-like n=1 Tax=Photinus pyralis TaxID=7054 RepID=UPI0012673AB8|nr:nose resistant to fluoxetine protein 6-like [Photinus pyralis]